MSYLSGGHLGALQAAGVAAYLYDLTAAVRLLLPDSGKHYWWAKEGRSAESSYTAPAGVGVPW